MKKLLTFTIIALICTILFCIGCFIWAFMASYVALAAFMGACGGWNFALIFVYIKLLIEITLEIKSKGE